MNPGDYPLTVEVFTRIATGETNAHGHKNYSWKRTTYAAARRWEMTNTERSSAPIENQSTSIRLLCRAVRIKTNQRVKFEREMYKVTSAEVRDKWDCLITIEPI